MNRLSHEEILKKYRDKMAGAEMYDPQRSYVSGSGRLSADEIASKYVSREKSVQRNNTAKTIKNSFKKRI